MLSRLRGLVLAVVVLSAMPAFVIAADFQAGVAVVDITAPPAYRMSGYFSERLNTGIHDPLSAKAVVFRQGRAQAALVFCDLIGISRTVSGRAREQAAQMTGIPASSILIHGTHSHTGPLYDGALRQHFHDLAIEKHGRDPSEEIDYSAFLVQRIVEAISQAHAGAQRVTILAGIAQQRGLSFNRRFHMQDGSVRFNPGKLNLEIIRPAGPVDTDVGVVMLQAAASKQNVAALTVFALHLDTVGGTEYSADYPFYLERTLRQSLGNQFVSMFGNGTCGDINHVDVTNALPQKGHEEAARIGAALAETVSRTIPAIKPVGAPKLAVRSAKTDVPVQQYAPEEIAQAKRDIFKVGTSQLSFLEQVKATKIINLQLRPSETLPLEVQVFRLSDDLAIVGLPGEVFVELGLAIKGGSPFARTLVIELCNDNPAYIPTKKAFAEGSYETVNSLVQPGGGEALVETALRLLKELKSAE
ncbi:MAG TPA: neutral/alkaline non-lysosomal ceramidase N-terminal domain-containing protein [Planctomycetaceae bacterium]|nr:neutral/alkaline non-lysosomal ceramidase N-terminal domain-containing protein [Planctomycetaceae bacterium]